MSGFLVVTGPGALVTTLVEDADMASMERENESQCWVYERKRVNLSQSNRWYRSLAASPPVAVAVVSAEVRRCGLFLDYGSNC